METSVEEGKNIFKLAVVQRAYEECPNKALGSHISNQYIFIIYIYLYT